MPHQALKQDTQIPAAWPKPAFTPMGLVLDDDDADQRAGEVVALVAPAPALEAPDQPQPESAAPDVPVAVGGLIVGTYAALIAILAAFMARSPLAAFSIAICAFFVLVFFTVPALFLRVEADQSRRPTFDRFMREGLDTLTGRTGGKDALFQMLIVPVLLAFGLAAMGITGLIYIG